MTTPITLPLWFFILIVLFAAVTFASHFLFPSVRWFLRRRMERAVARLNTRLERPIEPFRLLRRYDLIQRLIYDPEVSEAIVEHARETGVREDVAFQEARGYAREIVPSFSAYTYFSWGVWAARKLSNALYKVELSHQDAEALAAIDREATVVFVMNHRSNMDYVLVTYLAADRSALSYAVGEWGQVWPLSRLIRSMGAYFIRRRSRNALYRRVLRRYVTMATEAGVTQAIFPEGGLSLDGALAPPKLGLLTYITETYDPEARDVVFVPVGLNYDRVLEDSVLVAAAERGGRRFDARMGRIARAVVRQLWLRMTRRFQRFGTAAVRFGMPLSLNAEPALADKPQDLARALAARIGAAVPLLPVPLVALAMEQAEGAVSRADLKPMFERLCGNDLSLDEGIDGLLRRGILTEGQGGLNVVEGQEGLLRFYANSVRHLMPGLNT